MSKNESAVLKYGEITLWSLLGAKGLTGEGYKCYQ